LTEEETLEVIPQAEQITKTQDFEVLLCPHCKGEVAFHHADDVGTKFYECQKCRQYTTKPMTKPPTVLVLTPQCESCGTPFGDPLRCEFLPDQRDGVKCNAHTYKNHADADKEEFNPVRFAKLLLNEHAFLTMRDDDTLYVYHPEDRIYKPDGEQLIRERMVELLDEETRENQLKDIRFYIKSVTYTDRPEPPKDLIVVENGVLNVATGELDTESNTGFLTIKIPVTFDPSQDCPLIKNFILEVVGKEYEPLVQEFIGYCMYRVMFIHKAFMLVGNGANGKTTLTKIITALLGAQNVSNITLQALCYNRFAASQLHNKLANLCADTPNRVLEHTGMFKMLSGNDSVYMEEKFKRGFNAVNLAKLLFACNEVPETMDDTDAFFRRWVIIPFNNIFIGAKDDKRLLGKLATPTELSGLLNYALEGLKRLLENQGFSENDDLEDLRTKYIRQSNSAKAYIEENLAYDPSDKAIVAESALYEKYITFCTDNGLHTMKKRNLTENMHQYLPHAKQTNARIDGKVTHVWQYVIINFVATVATTLLNHISNGTFENNDSRERMGKICLNGAEATVATNVISSCWICQKPLPEDTTDTGIYDGKPVHRVCLLKLEEGLIGHE